MMKVKSQAKLVTLTLDEFIESVEILYDRQSGRSFYHFEYKAYAVARSSTLSS